MSSSSNEEEPLIGSRIKMRIKFTNPTLAPAPAPELVKKDPDHHPNNPSPNPDYPIPAPTQAPSPTNSSPSSMGKRKKKPKLMHDEFLFHSGKRRRKSISISDHVGSSCGPKLARRRKSLNNGVHNLDEVKTPAMIRAEEFRSTLSSEFPSFTKLMERSHVFNGFWMGVPGYFSKEHLPRTDTMVILVDESEKEYQLKYIGEKMGLSAGWRKFSVEQNLHEDDVLVFQLVEPFKFKVYVVRANDFNEVDGALSLLNLDAHAERNDAEKDGEEDRQAALCLSSYKMRRVKSLQCGTLMMKNKKVRARKSVPRTLQLAKKLENGYKRINPSSSNSPNLKNIVNFEDFTIIVDGLCIDSELPEDIRAKYYDLCSTRKDLLHARLVQGLNSKLIAGIIYETVDISDAVKTCTIMTCRNQYVNWEKTLKSFELLGMRVGFLHDRVRRLLGLAFESDEALETRKYMEAKLGRFRAEDEIVNLETKIVELKEASGKYSEDIQSLKLTAESFELKFHEEVNAPW